MNSIAENATWIEVSISPDAKCSGFGLKANCLIHIVKGRCCFRGAVLTAESAEVLYHYENNDSTIYDMIQPFQDHPCVLRLRYLSAPRKYKKSAMNLFSVPPSWMSAADSIGSRQSQRSATVVTGPPSVGKSTFVNFLTNRLVCNEFYSKLNSSSSESVNSATDRQPAYRTVAVIDVDVGQPLKGVPGCLSLTLYSSADLGSHPSQHQSYVVGFVSPQGEEVEYVKAFLNIFWLYRRYAALEKDATLPLIVNCCGWNMFMGAQLIDLFSGIVEATDVVHINRSDVLSDGSQVVYGTSRNGLIGCEHRTDIESPLKDIIDTFNVGDGPFPYLPSKQYFMHELESVGHPNIVSLKRNETDVGKKVAAPTTSAFKRYMRLAKALFSMDFVMSVPASSITSKFVMQYVRSATKTLPLKSVNFVSGSTENSEQVDLEFSGSVVYITQEGWLVCVGIVTEIDWQRRKIYIYTRRDSPLQPPIVLSPNASYQLSLYPEFSMDEIVHCLKEWKNTMIIAHEVRLGKSELSTPQIAS